MKTNTRAKAMGIFAVFTIMLFLTAVRLNAATQKVVTAIATLTGAGSISFTPTLKRIDTAVDLNIDQIDWNPASITIGTSKWVIANTYIKLDFVTTKVGGYLQIYTDNTTESATRANDQFVVSAVNISSLNPAGLYNTTRRSAPVLPMAWAVLDNEAHSTWGNFVTILEGKPTGFSCSIISPQTTTVGEQYPYPLFHHFFDTATVQNPADTNCTRTYAQNETIRVIDSDLGMHHAEGPNNFFNTSSPDYLYFAANFLNAKTATGDGVKYRARIVLETITE